MFIVFVAAGLGLDLLKYITVLYCMTDRPGKGIDGQTDGQTIG